MTNCKFALLAEGGDSDDADSSFWALPIFTTTAALLSLLFVSIVEVFGGSGNPSLFTTTVGVVVVFTAPLVPNNGTGLIFSDILLEFPLILLVVVVFFLISKEEAGAEVDVEVAIETLSEEVEDSNLGGVMNVCLADNIEDCRRCRLGGVSMC